MPRSTIILGIISVLLALTTGFIGWQLWIEQQGVPRIDGSYLNLGLPGANGDSEKVVTADSALLYDASTNSILFEQNGFERRPIASITKLMTAMVALDYGIPWGKEAEILLEEHVNGSRLIVHPGEKIYMRDLFAASLVGSANNATIAYVRELGVTHEEFVRQMNRKAITLGLEQTEFVDVTGLDSDNVSTAYEVAQLANVAFTQYPVIGELTAQTGYDISFIGSDREHTIKNPNKIISEWGDPLTGSKTGYIYEAGYCLVAKGADASENRISVILGSPSEIAHFVDTKKLLNLPVN